MKKELYQKEESKIFYENRYKKGYMDEWPILKKQGVFEVIKSLNLPESGNALDFGCCNGVFTDVLRQALPKWKIYGCDISTVSIDNAKNRFPTCSFFVSDNEKISDIKFDFLFSHHVLEHVFDIEKTIQEINILLKPKSSVLHIFPCGNKDSFEYNVCKIRMDGINREMENRFFFEDEGHIRRLTTEQTNLLMNKYGFSLEKDFYSNQYYGALKWITQTINPKFIMEFTNHRKAIDKASNNSLLLMRFNLLLLYILQLPSCVFIRTREELSKAKGLKQKMKYYCVLILVLIPFFISYPAYAIMNYYANKEWNYSKHLKNGSEMYLFYNRK